MSEQDEILVPVKAVGIFQGISLRSRFHPNILAEVLPRRELHIFLPSFPTQIHPFKPQKPSTEILAVNRLKLRKCGFLSWRSHLDENPLLYK